MDPFESVTPIGTREPAPLAMLSTAEKRQRVRQHNAGAGRHAKEPRAKSSVLPPPPRAPRIGEVSVAELIAMTTAVTDEMYTIAMNDDAKGADRKHASVSFGVMVDKLTMLRAQLGRHAPGEVDQLRPGVRDLVRVILEGAA